MLKLNQNLFILLLAFTQLAFISGARASLGESVGDAFSTLEDNIARTWQAPQDYDLYAVSYTHLTLPTT